MMRNMGYYIDILHMDTYNLRYRLFIMLIQNFHYDRYRLFITLWIAFPSRYRLFTYIVTNFAMLGKDLFHLGI